MIFTRLRLQVHVLKIEARVPQSSHWCIVLLMPETTFMGSSVTLSPSLSLLFSICAYTMDEACLGLGSINTMTVLHLFGYRNKTATTTYCDANCSILVDGTLIACTWYMVLLVD